MVGASAARKISFLRLGGGPRGSEVGSASVLVVGPGLRVGPRSRELRSDCLLQLRADHLSARLRQDSCQFCFLPFRLVSARGKCVSSS